MLDDLLMNQKEDENSSFGQVEDIPISLIDDFQNHPFKVVEDDDLLQMAESVMENGILSPAIIRRKENGRYEMISGHRRKRASELAMKEKIPCVVKRVSDEEATILMVDSNIQREKILPRNSVITFLESEVKVQINI